MTGTVYPENRMGKKKGKKKRSSGAKRKGRRKRAWKDVKLAQKLIAWGVRNNRPQVISVAARMLLVSANVLSPDDNDQREAPERFAKPKRKPQDPGTGPDSMAAPAGLTPRGLVPRGGTPSTSNRWEAVIDKGKTFTIQPNPLFAKKTQAVVRASAQHNARLFIYWRRVDMVPDPNDFASGQTNVTAKWRTGIKKARWEVQIENRSGPDGLKVDITANSIG